MKQSWSNTVFPIAAIFSFRMLGLFMLIPVFTVYAGQLKHSTPALMGIALGCYGLSQGLLQMPFGLLSDRFGRKPIISAGLILFATGSFLGALTDSIYGMILARTLQGTGAIGSVLIALLADLTSNVQRTRAMAVIGMTIGISFSLAMILSPIVTAIFGLSGIFYLTAILSLIGLILLHKVIPTPTREHFHEENETKTSLLKNVLSDPALLRLDLGIFIQHMVLTSTFFVLPMQLLKAQQTGALTSSWHFYLPLMLLAFLLMAPCIYYSEKKHKTKLLFIVSVFASSAAQFFLSNTQLPWWNFCSLMLIYFVAFNILEAVLPSLISKNAHPARKGTAMGVYSSCQFLGIFAGGSMAGILFQHFGAEGIFILNAILGLGWGLLILPMQADQSPL